MPCGREAAHGAHGVPQECWVPGWLEGAPAHIPGGPAGSRVPPSRCSGLQLGRAFGEGRWVSGTFSALPPTRLGPRPWTRPCPGPEAGGQPRCSPGPCERAQAPPGSSGAPPAQRVSYRPPAPRASVVRSRLIAPIPLMEGLAQPAHRLARCRGWKDGRERPGAGPASPHVRWHSIVVTDGASPATFALPVVLTALLRTW